MRWLDDLLDTVEEPKDGCLLFELLHPQVVSALSGPSHDRPSSSRSLVTDN